MSAFMLASYGRKPAIVRCPGCSAAIPAGKVGFCLDCSSRLPKPLYVAIATANAGEEKAAARDAARRFLQERAR